MASVSSLIVAVRSTGAAALTRTAGQFRALATTVRSSSFAMRAHTRQISTVAGAYRGANGLWYNANGTLVLQRNHVRNLTTAYGRLARIVGAVGRVLGAAVSSIAAMGPMLAKAAGAAALLGVKITAVLAVAFPLVAVLGNLLPLVMHIAPAFASLALLGFGLALAFKGVGTALSAGLSGDAEAFAKALKKLPPPAREAVRAMVEMRDAFKPIQQKVQAEMFAGMSGEIRTLTRLIAPVADVWLPRLGRRFAEVRGELASGLARFAADGRLERVWRMIHAAVSSLLGTLPHLGRAFGDILEVAAPRFAGLAGSIESATKRFADWIRQAKESGKLGEWLDKAQATFGTLKSIVGNLGEMLGAIWKGANNEGESFIQKVERITQAMADWLNSTDGQQLISTLASIVGWLIACEPAFRVVAAAGQWSMVTISTAWGALKAVVGGVILYILGAYEWILSGAAKAFSWIPGLGPKLQAAAAQFQAWKNQVNAAINGIQDTVTVTVFYKAVRIGPHLVNNAQMQGEYSSGIGGRAAGGPVKKGTPYIVGEKRPELFVPNQNGTIIPKVPAPSSGAPWAGSSGGAGASLVVAGGDQGVSSLIRYLIRTGALTLGVRNGRVVIT